MNDNPKSLRAIIVRPNQEPEVTEVVNEMWAWQATVGGRMLVRALFQMGDDIYWAYDYAKDIRVITLDGNSDDQNLKIGRTNIYGTVLFLANKYGSNYRSLTDDEVVYILKLLKGCGPVSYEWRQNNSPRWESEMTK